MAEHFYSEAVVLRMIEKAEKKARRVEAVRWANGLWSHAMQGVDGREVLAHARWEIGREVLPKITKELKLLGQPQGEHE